MNEVRLVDLEIIKRYSLAIRQETASAEELLAALDASREAVASVLAPAKKASSRSRKKASEA